MSNRWLAVALIDRSYKVRKESLVKKFQKEYAIDLRPFFYPLSMMPPFQKYARGDMHEHNEVAYDIAERAICLPSSFRLTEKDVARTCKLLRETLLLRA